MTVATWNIYLYFKHTFVLLQTGKKMNLDENKITRRKIDRSIIKSCIATSIIVVGR